jgi:hypothetical protein
MREFEPALMDDLRSGIRGTPHNEALRGRALESFPPLYRPLRGDATTVPTDELLQGVPEGEHSFPVSQRFVLRVRDDTTIALIQP